MTRERMKKMHETLGRYGIELTGVMRIRHHENLTARGYGGGKTCAAHSNAADGFRLSVWNRLLSDAELMHEKARLLQRLAEKADFPVQVPALANRRACRAVQPAF